MNFAQASERSLWTNAWRVVGCGPHAPTAIFSKTRRCPPVLKARHALKRLAAPVRRWWRSGLCRAFARDEPNAGLEQAPGSLHRDLDRKSLDVTICAFHRIGDFVRAAVFRIRLVEDRLCRNFKLRASRKLASLGLPALQRQGPVLGRGHHLDLGESPRGALFRDVPMDPEPDRLAGLGVCAPKNLILRERRVSSAETQRKK